MCSSSFLLHCTEEQMICRNRYRDRQTERNREKETTDDLQEFQQETERDKCVEHNIKVRQRIRKKYGNKRRSVQRAEKLEQWLNIHKG